MFYPFIQEEKKHFFFLNFVAKYQKVITFLWLHLHVKTITIIEQHLPLFNQKIWIVRM